MLWQTKQLAFDLSHRGAIMGVLNVTPDSFSDGGCWLDVDSAVRHGCEMVAEGAEIVDVGGESTRPRSVPVEEQEELRRVLPVIERLSAHPQCGTAFVISIDTRKPAVARAAVQAGAAIINDIGGLRDQEMLNTVKDTQAGVVIMHMQGEPQSMQDAPYYLDVVKDVRDFFCVTLSRCLRWGVPAPSIAFDPGIGFGKTVSHNLELLRRLPELQIALHPLLVGVSRKSFIGKAIGSESITDREWPTAALTSYGRECGARVFRVHEVQPNMEALRMTEAILAA